MFKYIFLIIGLIILSFEYDRVVLAKCGVLIITLLCIFLGKKERYIANPYYLFILCPISLLIYFNISSIFMMNLTVDTINLGAINMLGFVAALYYTPGCKNTNYNFSITSKRILVIHTFAFWGIAQLGRFIPFLASILWIFCVPAIVCAMKTKMKSMLLTVAGMFMLSMALGGVSKTTMLMYCITILICYEKYYITTRKQLKKVAIMFCGGIVLMVFSFSFANKDRGDYDAEAGISYYKKQGVEWNYSAKYFMPYMYLTNGWTNLQYIQDTQNERTYGLWLVKPFLGYFKLDDGIENDLTLDSYSSFNTPTFIACGYKDFGYWGSIITSLILGIFVKRVYSRYKISKSPFDTASYVLVALGTLEMFFSNHFLMQSYPITCVILMLVYKFFILREKVIEADVSALK